MAKGRRKHRPWYVRKQGMRRLTAAGSVPPRTRFPFEATINGQLAIVSRSAYGIEIDYPTGGDDGIEGLRLRGARYGHVE